MSGFSEIKKHDNDTGRQSSFDPDKRVDVKGTEGRLDTGKKAEFDPDKRVGDVQNKEIGKSNSINSQEYRNENSSLPNSSLDVDGNKYYTDDNGKEYRINNELLPNNTYEVNGYKYETDSLGRKTSVEGVLQVKDHENYRPIKDSKSDIGKGDEKESDDRGHLIGDQFNGSNGLENLVAQDSNLNQNDYKNFENQLAKYVNEGNEVYTRIDITYPGESYRPDSFMVSYSINGEENIRVFSNESRGETK